MSDHVVWKSMLNQVREERDALAAELAAMTADYHRWHDAYMELAYPGGGQRVAVTPDQARIRELERELAFQKDLLSQYHAANCQSETPDDAVKGPTVCQHDLQRPDATIKVVQHADHQSASCRVCCAQWANPPFGVLAFASKTT
jgi:hypothetical protein